jgi:hypothetical protein
MECGCGCGGETRGGSFLPGHDQKLRIEVERQAGGLKNLKIIVERVLGHSIKVKEPE